MKKYNTGSNTVGARAEGKIINNYHTKQTPKGLPHNVFNRNGYYFIFFQSNITLNICDRRAYGRCRCKTN